MARWHRFYGTVDVPSGRRRLEQFERLTEPATFTWSDDLAVRLLPGEDFSRAVYVSGTYEPNTLCVLRALLDDGDVFLDVGAHAGVVSLAASRWVGHEGHVFSFEPSEREYERLVESLALSSAGNVTPLRAAAAATTGICSLRVADPAHSGLNTLGERFAYDDVDTARVERVETIRLDDFVATRQVDRIAAVKLDVEGGEAAALAGAVELLDRRRPALVVEIVGRALEANGSSPTELEALLHEAGYRFYAIDDSASLAPLSTLHGVDEENVVALPVEESERFVARVRDRTRSRGGPAP